MTLWGALVGGVVGTIVLTSGLRVAQELGVTRMDIPLLLGTIFTDRRDRASVIGYVVSSATVLSVNRARSIPAARGTGAGKRWFALTGALNGFGLWCMYVALNRAPVTEIAPIVAAFPLVTTAAAALSGEEPVTWRMATGSVITVGAIILLVA